MPTCGTLSWTAVTLDGIGDGVGASVGAVLALGLAVALDEAATEGSADGVTRATGVEVVVGKGGMLVAGAASRSRVPTIMSATPANPSTVGSAQEERRFTWPSLAAVPTHRWRGPSTW